MKTIKIAHLYYDLMNLYGESGNITALVAAFKKQGINPHVDYLSKGSKIDFNKYDIFYIGCGTEAAQELARTDILRYKEEIKKVIKKKTFIATGNSYELFGSTLNDQECLEIFNFKSRTVRDRIVGEQVNKTYIVSTPILGFQNRGSINDNEENNFFEVVSGNANNNKVTYEGIHIDNFYGTYTLGPLLIRNPHLTDKIVKDICELNNFKYKDVLDTTDYKAYEENLKIFNVKRDEN
jgi:CobQ-like glutamine amidotransferase family enzyme